MRTRAAAAALSFARLWRRALPRPWPNAACDPTTERCRAPPSAAERRRASRNAGRATADGPTVRSYDWTVARATRAPAGVERELVLVNGEFPGPAIHARLGDQVRVRVRNALEGDESTSVHFHGMHQRGSNAMDGVPGVTQCGIPPGGEMTYVFNVTQTGTFWWHSHSHQQRGDGMFGALVLTGPDEQYVAGRDYDDDLLVVVHDHYHRPAAEAYSWYLSRQSSGFEPVPDVGLINGRGRADCARLPAAVRPRCDASKGQTARFEFVPGRRYRLRIINTSSLAELSVSLDDHVLSVVEADSTEVEPLDVHYVPLGPGQRYSVLVEADSLLPAVLLRVHMHKSCFNYVNLALDRDFAAVVEYSAPPIGLAGRLRRAIRSASRPPVSAAWQDVLPEQECVDLDPTQLRPLADGHVPDADIRYQIQPKNIQLERMNLAPFGFINRTSFMPAIGAPNLHVALGLVDAADTVAVPTVSARYNTPRWGGDQLVVDVPFGSVVEIVIQNSDEAAHPFHLHGHDFWVLDTYAEYKIGLGAWRPYYTDRYRLEGALKRDTVMVPRRGYAVIRWVADNPGLWAMHCHILWHLSAGMMMQWSVGLDRVSEQPTAAMLEHCAHERELGAALLRPLPGDEFRKNTVTVPHGPTLPE
ncbi:Cupredoxin [Dipodascopsis tothii]|uniref:Cupredoxin n=1 Tax=Dipodascopsis tothii TaxID=44089 RepID=UPI0034CF8F2D